MAAGSKEKAEGPRTLGEKRVQTLLYLGTSATQVNISLNSSLLLTRVGDPNPYPERRGSASFADPDLTVKHCLN